MMRASGGMGVDTSPVGVFSPKAYRAELVRRPLAENLRPYLRALAQASGESFDAYWARSSALRHKLVQDLGVAGVEIWLRHDKIDHDAVYPLAAVPAGLGCPWSCAPDASTAVTVARILAPLAQHLPSALKRLRRHTRHLVALRRATEWFVLYVVPFTLHDGRPYFRLLVGGPPLPDAQRASVERTLGWRIPEPLRAFYAVHDGFGEIGAILGSLPRTGLVRAQDLARLDHILDDFGEPLPYDPADLLEFYPDGMGNGLSFHRRSRTDPDPPVVDRDHETGELVECKSFFTSLDKTLVRLDEE
jgi:hypothetical protein